MRGLAVSRSIKLTQKIVEYYVVAEKDLYSADPQSPDWPKLIGYSFARGRFLFLEGKGHALLGAEVDQGSPSMMKWQDLFGTLDAEWFLDFLKLNNFRDENDFLSKLTAISSPLKMITY